MKIRLLLIFLVLCYHQSFAQTNLSEQKEIEQKLMRNWIKYRVEMKDGSQIPNENIAKKAASMLIFKKGNVCVLISGKTAQQSVYTISSNALVLDRTASYVIEKLTEHELIFYGVFENIPDEEIIRYHYVSTTESSGQYFFRQFIKPNIRTKENLDTAYVFSEYVYPKLKYEAYGAYVVLDEFNDVYEQSYHLIERKFNFPENKVGNFLVSFSINKFGTLQNIEIKQSSDSSYNNALLNAVGSTRRLWLPAEYDDKKVETLFNYVFKYEGNNEFDLQLYQITKIKADKQFEKKEYVKAIKLYTKSILMQQEDFDLEPYYKRADSYFALKVNKNACLDWSYLSKKGQKKAEKLFFDNCMN